jgi:hypothetical protein
MAASLGRGCPISSVASEGLRFLADTVRESTESPR